MKLFIIRPILTKLIVLVCCTLWIRRQTFRSWAASKLSSSVYHIMHAHIKNQYLMELEYFVYRLEDQVRDEWH